MANNSSIEWTDATWNPIVGCSRVSEGCRNCYAERFAHRWAGTVETYKGVVESTPNGSRWTGNVKFIESRLDQPLRWRKPRRIFVNSMSDLFHENVPDEWIDRIFAVMALSPQHTFQILTKRPERMLEYFNAERFGYIEAIARKIHGKPLPPGTVMPWPLPNVWLGVSVENQKAADERIPLLLQTPAAVRFLSCEPLLGPVDLTRFSAHPLVPNAIPIDWVIAGGESGPGARPMHPDWVRELRDHCQAAGVPFFFKQWGEWAPGECANDGGPSRTEQVATYWNDEWQFDKLTPMQSFETHCDDAPDVFRFGKKKAGRYLDGRTWDEYPQA